MHGVEIAVIIWEVMGIVFILYGIYQMLSKRQKPFGFYANIKELPEVEDVKGYNRALGMLFCCYGAAFMLIGLPMLTGGLGVVLSMIGTLFITIALVALYTFKVEKKYRKQ